MQHLRWGILGTGNIANQFAEGVAHARRSRAVAVGSRTQRNADDFAGKFDIPHSHGTYEALIGDDAIDAIYISLPNSLHCEWTIKALEAGKHVLCEKPLAASAEEAQRMCDTAERQGRVLVEALMYRSHPLMHEVMRHVRDGAVGRVKLVRASFCFRTKTIDNNIRFDPSLAGGALMDIGCYCLSLAQLVTGLEPADAHAAAHLHESGVDDYAAGTVHYPNGVLATFTCGMTVQADNTASICGDEGHIQIPVPWKPPTAQARYIVSSMTPPRQDQPGRAHHKSGGRQEHEVDAPMPLYGLEADDFAATVLDDAAPAVTARESLSTMRLLDAMRRQVGVPVPA